MDLGLVQSNFLKMSKESKYKKYNKLITKYLKKQLVLHNFSGIVVRCASLPPAPSERGGGIQRGRNTRTKTSFCGTPNEIIG
jgi:hypothetical protein